MSPTAPDVQIEETKLPSWREHVNAVQGIESTRHRILVSSAGRLLDPRMQDFAPAQIFRLLSFNTVNCVDKNRRTLGGSDDGRASALEPNAKEARTHDENHQDRDHLV